MPRRVCVVIGPFIGWKSSTLPVPFMLPRKLNSSLPATMARSSPRLTSSGLRVTTSSGLPRSQARLSKSPKMWQLAHDASPLPEETVAS